MPDFNPLYHYEALKQEVDLFALPLHIHPELFVNLPNTAGIYRFYGSDNALLYIGKSISLKQRVRSHFTAANKDARERRLAQQVKYIDWIETAGELGALLLESALIKQHIPIFNRRLRRYKNIFTLETQANSTGYMHLKIITFDQAAGNLSTTYGFFRQKRALESLLHAIIKDHKLCPKLAGLEKASGACFYYQLHRCHGACIQQEPAQSYNQRLRDALQGIENRAWPYPGKIAIKEICALTQRCNFHVFDQWCYFKTVTTEAALFNKDKSKPPTLDIDIYKILASFLLKRADKLEIIMV